MVHVSLDLKVQAVIRKRGLLTRRESFGHIQYFTREMALQALKDVGYELLHYFDTPRCAELMTYLIQKVLRLSSRICFALHEDLAVRPLGGYSLLALAR